MKKLLLTIVSAMMMALLAPSKLYAQLNVNSNGSVNLSSTSTATNKVRLTLLTVVLSACVLTKHLMLLSV